MKLTFGRQEIPCICLTHLVVRLELELPELTATAEGSPATEVSSLQEREKNERAQKTI